MQPSLSRTYVHKSAAIDSRDSGIQTIPNCVSAERTHVYDDILFPTDGSDGAAAALAHAVEQAETHGATLHVLYVIDTTYLGSGAAEATTVEALQDTGETVLSETVTQVEDRGVTAERATRTGEPYREILDYADETGIDMIVMATHGRRGLDRYLLGSVTEKVVRASTAPVLTVRIDEE
jgi:nucleotide-binding universal stress UspA family protein